MDNTTSAIPGQATLPTLENEFGYDSLTHLSPKQERFCREFVLNNNDTKNAYLKAYPGSKEHSASANGCRLLKTEAAQERIAEIRQELNRRYAADAQSIVRLLTMSMHADRRQLVNDEGTPLELHELSPELAAIIDVEIVIDRHGKKHVIAVIPERLAAAKELANIMGLHKAAIINPDDDQSQKTGIEVVFVNPGE